MASTANVSVGKPKIGGAVSVGATSLTLPTDATTALASGFANLGYCSDDGMTKNITRDSEEIKSWGGDTVLMPLTDYAEEYKFKLLETQNIDVKKVLFGDSNVSGALSTGVTAIGNSKELPAKAWVIDMTGNGTLIRVVIPNGKVTEIGEISYVDNDAIGYEVTVKAMPDSSGNCSYEYTKTSSGS